VLKAYFDESESGPVFVLAGFVATGDMWEKFDKSWGKLLNRPCKFEPPCEPDDRDMVCAPLAYLHAVDMEGMGRKRFRRLGDNNRKHLIEASVTTILDSGIVGIGTGVVMSAYEKLPKELRKRLISPYHLCMRFALGYSAEQAKIFIGEDDQDIAYIFEDKKNWELTAHEVYASLRPAFQKQYRMGTLAFGSKERYKPLQAADRLAYETYHHFTEEPDRPMWNRLVASGRMFGRYCDESGVRNLNDLMRKDLKDVLASGL
jgi:Protein of unknown function (DUF3800)